MSVFPMVSFILFSNFVSYLFTVLQFVGHHCYFRVPEEGQVKSRKLESKKEFVFFFYKILISNYTKLKIKTINY